jgi:hypothetical protein
MGYGVEQAAQVEDRITKILMNAGQPQNEGNKQALRDQFNDASSIGVSPLHAADAYMNGGRLLCRFLTTSGWQRKRQSCLSPESSK